MGELTSKLEALESTLADRFPAFILELRPSVTHAYLHEAWSDRGVFALPELYREIQAWHDGVERHYELVPDLGVPPKLSISLSFFDDVVAQISSDLEDEEEGLQFGLPVLVNENNGGVLLHPHNGALYYAIYGEVIKIFRSLPDMIDTITEWWTGGGLIVDDDVFVMLGDFDVLMNSHRSLKRSWLPPSGRAQAPLAIVIGATPEAGHLGCDDRPVADDSSKKWKRRKFSEESKRDAAALVIYSDCGVCHSPFPASGSTFVVAPQNHSPAKWTYRNGKYGSMS